MESDYSRATIVMPYGTPVEKTLATAKLVVKGAEKTIAGIGSNELVKGIFTEIGSGGSHNVSIRVFLADPEIRNKIISNQEFTARCVITSYSIHYTKLYELLLPNKQDI